MGNSLHRRCFHSKLGSTRFHASIFTPEALESLIGLREQLHEHVPLRFGTAAIHTVISIGSIETFTAAFTFMDHFLLRFQIQERVLGFSILSWLPNPDVMADKRRNCDGRVQGQGRGIRMIHGSDPSVCLEQKRRMLKIRSRSRPDDTIRRPNL